MFTLTICTVLLAKSDNRSINTTCKRCDEVLGSIPSEGNFSSIFFIDELKIEITKIVIYSGFDKKSFVFGW